MINLGLKRTTRLLQQVAQNLLDQPQFLPPWKVIHIAGTNGKGSVAAYLSSLLKRTIIPVDGSEVRIGRFTSPHFIDRWDCITINDEAVDKNLFETVEQQVKVLGTRVAEELRHEAADPLAAQKDGPEDQVQADTEPTEFELLTATAFAIFSLPQPKACDIAIIECGLGGRLDATNALPDSSIEVSVITRIGLDHLNMLGGSLQSIVREKCGIFRKNTAVVIDGQNDRIVLNLIDEEIRKKYGDAATNTLYGDFVNIANASHLSSMVESVKLPSIKAQHFDSAPLFQGLLPHQQSNLCVALEVWNIMKKRIADKSNLAMKSSLEAGNNSISLVLAEAVLQDASKSYPARLQLLQPGWLKDNVDHGLPKLNETTVLLDGAHNEQSALVLRDFVEREARNRFSVSSVKDGQDDRTAATVDKEHLTMKIENGQLGHKVRTVINNGSEYTENQTSRPVIWVLALSSTKPPTEILNALFSTTKVIDNQQTLASQQVVSPSSSSSRPQIVFTSFGPVDNMPWVKAAPVANLARVAETLESAPYVHTTSENIVGALDIVEGLLKQHETRHESQKPLVVIAGSLYLASDFLRFLRDGRDAFTQHWREYKDRK